MQEAEAITAYVEQNKKFLEAGVSIYIHDMISKRWVDVHTISAD